MSQKQQTEKSTNCLSGKKSLDHRLIFCGGAAEQVCVTSTGALTRWLLTSPRPRLTNEASPRVLGKSEPKLPYCATVLTSEAKLSPWQRRLHPGPQATCQLGMKGQRARDASVPARRGIPTMFPPSAEKLCVSPTEGLQHERSIDWEIIWNRGEVVNWHRKARPLREETRGAAVQFQMIISVIKPDYIF